jgi:ERCC4-type nuclease
LAIKTTLLQMPEARVVIDTRERVGSNPTALSRIRNSSREELPFGDAWFYVDDKLEMVVERKTAPDFVGSVLHTRIAEQLRALLAFKQANPAIPVVIIIEGDLSQVDLRGVSPERFRSEIHNWTRIGITRLDTIDVEDTVEFYSSTLKKFETMGSVAQYQQLLIDTIPIMAAGKKSQVSPTNFLSVTLGNITGISADVATKIAQQYGSLYEFVNQFDAQQAQQLVVGKKKLGPKRANRIAAFIRGELIATEKRPKKAKK